MAALPYMPLYVADYLADAAHLTAAGHGAYLLLLMNYWQRGKPLPDDDRKLSRIARMDSDEWAEIRDDIAEFFEIGDGVWTHGRVERELESVREKSRKAADAGKASAQSRAAKSTPVQQSCNGRSTDAQQTFNHTDTDTDTDTDLEDTPPKPPSLEREAIQAYNAVAEQCDLPRCQKLTDARRKALRKRLADCGGMDGWQSAMDRIRGSPFLTGQNDRGWKADIDFVLRESSFTKLMEGKYDGATRTLTPVQF